jgi:hypothetical protein
MHAWMRRSLLVKPRKLHMLRWAGRLLYAATGRCVGLSAEQLSRCFTTDPGESPIHVTGWGHLGDTWPYFRWAHSLHTCSDDLWLHSGGLHTCSDDLWLHSGGSVQQQRATGRVRSQYCELAMCVVVSCSATRAGIWPQMFRARILEVCCCSGCSKHLRDMLLLCSIVLLLLLPCLQAQLHQHGGSTPGVRRTGGAQHVLQQGPCMPPILPPNGLRHILDPATPGTWSGRHSTHSALRRTGC